MAGALTPTIWRRCDDRLNRLVGNERRMGIALVGWSMKPLIVAQVVAGGQVRAVVIGIGATPWIFAREHAAEHCRKAVPDIAEPDVAAMVLGLEALVAAAIATVRRSAGNVARKTTPSARRAKTKLRRGNLRLEGGLEAGFLSQVRG